MEDRLSQTSYGWQSLIAGIPAGLIASINFFLKRDGDREVHHKKGRSPLGESHFF